MIGGAVPCAQILKVAQSTSHQQKFSHREHTALDGAGSQGTDSLHTAKPGRTVLDEQCVDGIGLLQHKADLVGVTLGLQLQHLRLCLLTDTSGGSPLDDFIQFQCF